MSEKSEHKSWQAWTTEATTYLQEHGPVERMSPQELAEYEALVEGARQASFRHDAARDAERGNHNG